MVDARTRGTARTTPPRRTRSQDVHHTAHKTYLGAARLLRISGAAAPFLLYLALEGGRSVWYSPSRLRVNSRGISSCGAPCCSVYELCSHRAAGSGCGYSRQERCVCMLRRARATQCLRVGVRLLHVANPHAVLGVSPGSSRDAVRKRYYDLAMQLHPDMSGGAQSCFRKEFETPSTGSYLPTYRAVLPSLPWVVCFLSFFYLNHHREAARTHRLGRKTPDWHPCLSGQGGPPQGPQELRLAAFLPL